MRNPCFYDIEDQINAYKLNGIKPNALVMSRAFADGFLVELDGHGIVRETFPETFFYKGLLVLRPFIEMKTVKWVSVVKIVELFTLTEDEWCALYGRLRLKYSKRMYESNRQDLHNLICKFEGNVRDQELADAMRKAVEE